ncbi:unnamed protein product, partial [Phaeothamnion confervicola]
TVRRGVVIAGIVGVVAILAIGMLASADALPSWVPVIGGKQSIHVRVAERLYGSTLTAGSSCLPSIGVDVESVIVKDADGTIVGSKAVGWGTVVEPGVSVVSCVLDFTIDAPKSGFYSVYFDNRLVRTFSRSDAESGVLEVSAD